MDVVIRQGSPASRPAGALAVGWFQNGAQGAAGIAVDRATRGAITRLIRSRDFSGRHLEFAVLYPNGIRARRLLLVGLGPRADLTLQRVRESAALAARRAREMRAGTLVTLLPSGSPGLDPESMAQAVAEGSVLGHYRFGAYRTEPPPAPLRRIEIVENDAVLARRLRAAVERGRCWADGTCLARDLAFIPGQDLTPERLAARAAEVGQQSGAKVSVLGPTELERLGMGAVLAVGRGSVHAPRFIVLERGLPPARSGKKSVSTGRGASARRETNARGARGSATLAPPASDPGAPLVVIGKGVTFDTGGISLKPRENMHKMKYDMSGAAAVLGMFAALPTLAPSFPVVGLIPAAENMPGGRALKPGDVVRAMDGTTIEVTNTDAEGRLLLADALTYARRYQPRAVVDLATLTGAISIALGLHAAGLFSADETLADELLRSSAATGERLWRMPMWDEARPELKSDTADLVNSSGAREGGAVVAAVFLSHFARGLRWAHLDIASTAWAPTERPHEGRGPTGFGVRLLLEWISRQVAAGAPRP
jgi:leucyl aminopeptidase